MAKYVPFFHSQHKTIVKMEVRAANRGRGDLDYRVRRLLDLGIGNRINSNIVFAMPAKSFHEKSSSSCWIPISFACPLRINYLAAAILMAAFASSDSFSSVC